MARDKYTVYVFAKFDDARMVIIDYALSWETELKDLLSNPNNKGYYCACIYNVKSLNKAKQTIKLIDTINPNLRVKPKSDFYNLNVDDATKILKLIADNNGRAKHFFEKPVYDENNVKVGHKTAKTSTKKAKPKVEEVDISEKSIKELATSKVMCKPLAIDVFKRYTAHLGHKINLENKNTFFCSKHKSENYYPVSIRKEKFDNTIYLILNDTLNKILHLFKITPSKIDKSQLVTNEYHNDMYSMQILYGDDEYKDILSDVHIRLDGCLLYDYSYRSDAIPDESEIINARPSIKLTNTPKKKKKRKSKNSPQKILGEEVDADKYKPTSIEYGPYCYQPTTFEDFAFYSMVLFLTIKKDEMDFLLENDGLKNISKDINKFPNYVEVTQYGTTLYFNAALSDKELYHLVVDTAKAISIDFVSFVFYIQRK